MAKTQTNKVPSVEGGAVVRERYHREPIDRSFSAESSRRNIEVIIWYKRLINAILGLLVASCIFTMIGVVFAWVQPMPRLYGSAQDGSLRPIEYVRSQADPRLGAMREALSVEDESRKKINVKTGAVEAIRSEGAAPTIAPAISKEAMTTPNPSR